MRALDESTIAHGYVVHGQDAQAANTEVLADERADDIAVYDAAFDIIDGIATAGSWFDGREIAQQATGECIARARGIDDFCERVSGGAEEDAIRAKKQRSIAALLDDDVFWT